MIKFIYVFFFILFSMTKYIVTPKKEPSKMTQKEALEWERDCLYMYIKKNTDKKRLSGYRLRIEEIDKMFLNEKIANVVKNLKTEVDAVIKKETKPKKEAKPKKEKKVISKKKKIKPKKVEPKPEPKPEPKAEPEPKPEPEPIELELELELKEEPEEEKPDIHADKLTL